MEKFKYTKTKQGAVVKQKLCTARRLQGTIRLT